MSTASPSPLPDHELVPSSLVFVVALGTTCSAFMNGLTGFGAGIIFQIWFLLMAMIGIPGTGDLQRILGVSVIMLGINAIQIATPILMDRSKWNEIRWDYLCALAPGYIGFAYVGTWAITAIDNIILKRILGILFLSFATYQMFIRLKSYIPKKDTPPPDHDNSIPNHENSDLLRETPSPSLQVNAKNDITNVTPIPNPIDITTVQIQSQPIYPLSRMERFKHIFITWIKRPVIWAAFITGMTGGFLNGAFGTGGPPQIMFFSMVPATKSQIRGTTVCLGLLQLPFRVSAALLFGIFTTQDWPLYVTCPIMVIMGTTWGSRLHYKVDVNTILIVLQILILLSTIGLIKPADGSTFGWIMLFVYVGMTGTLMMGIGIILYLRQRYKQHSMDEHHDVETTTVINQ